MGGALIAVTFQEFLFSMFIYYFGFVSRVIGVEKVLFLRTKKIIKSKIMDGQGFFSLAGVIVLFLT